MKNIIPFLLGLAALLLPLCVSAQDILQDAGRLDKAINLIEDTLVTSDLQLAAAARVMAILDHYHEANPQEPESDCLSWYGKQPYLNQLLKSHIQEKIKAASADSTYKAIYKNEQDSLGIKEGHRQVMLQQMKSVRSQTTYEPLELTFDEAIEYMSAQPNPVEALRAETRAQQPTGLIQPGISPLIEGVANLLVKRAGEEMIVAYFNRMNDKKVAGLRILFPGIITHFENPGVFSTSFLNRLRDALARDIQLMPYSIPKLVADTNAFKPLHNRPVVQHLRVSSNLLGMSQQGFSIDQMFPVMEQRLYQQYLDSRQRRNQLLAEALPNSPSLEDSLMSASKELVDTIFKVYDLLDRRDRNIRGATDNYRIKTDLPDDSTPYLNALKPEDAFFSIEHIPALLQDKLDYEKLDKSLDSYDQYFAQDWQPGALRSAGLELLERLTDETAEQSFLKILQAWHDELTPWEKRLHEYEHEQRVSSEDRKHRLSEMFASADRYLPAMNELEQNGFKMLKETMEEEHRPSDANLDSANQEKAWSNHYDGIAERLQNLVFRATDINQSVDSKTFLYPTTTPPELYYPGFKEDMKHLTDLRDRVRKVLNQIKMANQSFSSQETAMRSLEGLVQISALASNLLYCLLSPGETEDKFLSVEKIHQSLQADANRVPVSGLLYLRMSQAIPGITLKGDEDILLKLLTRTGRRLEEARPIADTNDMLGAFHRVRVGIKILTDLIEEPLLPKTKSGKLADQFDGLGDWVNVADKTSDLYYYVANKDYPQAVSSGVKLLQYLSGRLEADIGAKKQKTIVSYLLKYGTTIGDLVAARDGKEVESLLSSLANPPGGSIDKRKSPLTVCLNSYGGATFGRQWLRHPDQGKEFREWSFAPTLPLGISVTTTLGDSKKAFTLFFNFLDFGMLLSSPFGASGGESIDPGQPKITFKNIFQPGLRLQYNFPESPFYFGIGGQYGLQFRTVDQEVMSEMVKQEVGFQSWRVFGEVGIDVPLRMFYKK